MLKKEKSKRLSLKFQVRFTKAHRSLLNAACGAAELPLAVWLRTRAITAAREELAKAGKPVPFVG